MNAMVRNHGLLPNRGLQTLGWPVPAALTAAAYYGAARLGLLEQLVRGQVTPLWPPTGIAVAALLLFGLRVWPGIALGALAVNVTLGPSVAAVLVIVLGNTLATVCAYLLLRRAGFHDELDRLWDAVILVFLGALCGTLVSATMGTSTLVISGALHTSDFWPTWSVWWTGDAMGVLVVTPFLLVARRARLPHDVPALRWAEAAVLTAGIVLVTLLATRTHSTALLFLVFPFLMWAAFRFGLAGAVLAALFVATMAILAAGRGTGPFTDHNLLANMVTLQAFNGAAALTALVLAAAVTERDRTHEEIKRVCEELTDVVGALRLGTDTERRPPGGGPGRRSDGA
jgi:integral membrane sensor domain MASE1